MHSSFQWNFYESLSCVFTNSFKRLPHALQSKIVFSLPPVSSLLSQILIQLFRKLNEVPMGLCLNSCRPYGGLVFTRGTAPSTASASCAFAPPCRHPGIPLKFVWYVKIVTSYEILKLYVSTTFSGLHFAGSLLARFVAHC